MQRYLLALSAVLCVLVLSACHGPMTHKHRMQRQAGCGNCCKLADKTGTPAAVATERADVVYACACGAGCDCNTLSKSPGECACGKPLRWHHVLKVEGDEALLCTCKEGCNCKLDPADPTKCACGNPVKRVSLKGSGLYFCNCGGSCTCNTVRAEAGECRCGMPLKQMN